LRTTLFLIGLLLAGVLVLSPTGAASELDFLDEAWEQRADMDLVAETLEKAREMDEELGNPDFLWRKARLYYWYGDYVAQERNYKLENFDRGLELVERAAELDDTNPDIFYWKASLTGMRGQTRGVLQSLFMVSPMKEALEKTIELDPEYASAYYVLGILYREVPGWPLSIGDDAKSVEYLEKALSFEPDNLEWKLELALSLLEKGERNQARNNLEDILDYELEEDTPLEWVRAQEKARDLLEEEF